MVVIDNSKPIRPAVCSGGGYFRTHFPNSGWLLSLPGMQFFSLLISLTHHFIKVTFWYHANMVSIDWSNTLEENYNFYYVMQLRAGLLVWERWVGVGNRGSKPPYLLCLASSVSAHFLFCFLLPPCSLFSLQKIRHCCKILPLLILLVLPPLPLSSPIPLLPPISPRIPFPVFPQPVNMRNQKWLEST